MVHGSSGGVVMATNNSRVGRLKHRFQEDGNEMGNGGGTGTQNNSSWRQTTDNKRLRAEETTSSKPPRNGNGNIGDGLDLSVVNDPTFFESTNHVQRFKYTRAIFAKMEEQNMKEQEQQQRKRRVGSPARVELGNKLSPVNINYVATPAAATTTRSYMPNQRGAKPPVSANKPRSTSVENLSNADQSRNVLSTKDLTRSEMDLHQGGGDSHLSRPSPRSLILQFEQGRPTPVDVPDDHPAGDASSPVAMATATSPVATSPNKPAVKPASVLSPTTTMPTRSFAGSDFVTPQQYHKPPLPPTAKVEPKDSKVTTKETKVISRDSKVTAQAPRKIEYDRSSSFTEDTDQALEDWKKRLRQSDRFSKEIRDNNLVDTSPSYGSTKLLESASASAIEVTDSSVARSNSSSSIAKSGSQRTSRIDTVPAGRRWDQRFKSDPSMSSSDYRARYENIRKDLEDDNDYQEAVARWRDKLRRRHSKDRDTRGENRDSSGKDETDDGSLGVNGRPASLNVQSRTAEDFLSSSGPASYHSKYSSSGVLLNKRRSRGEDISKEEIEASLKQADLYWKNNNETSFAERRGLTDSTYSSGSGEEMAKSDSNLDFDMLSPADESGVGASVTKQSDWLNSVRTESQTTNSKPVVNDLFSGAFLPRTDTLEKALNQQDPRSPSPPEEELPPLPKFPLKDESDDEDNKASSSNRDRDASPAMDTGMREDEETEIRFDTEMEADYVDISREVPSNGLYQQPMKKPPPFPGEKGVRYGSDDLLQDAREDYLAHEREEGDGTEEPTIEMDPSYLNGQDYIDYEGTDYMSHIWDPFYEYGHTRQTEQVTGAVEFLANGNFTYEVVGIPEKDPDDEFFPTAKKPSKVKFSFSPIKVFSTYSADDYDRHNEDIDPMAASAEYELEKRVERMDQFDVQLEKGNEGLGLSIIGMGVGADAGLEKLGIFIKTLTPGGAAERDGRIQVNDQIIEVDGKSLVGVTQAYAASVLRNTKGSVKFLIGREKDPSNSEVARLIQQSLEQDRRRAEAEEQRRRLLEEASATSSTARSPDSGDDVFRSPMQTGSSMEELQETTQVLRDGSPDTLREDSPDSIEPPPLPASPPPMEEPHQRSFQHHSSGSESLDGDKLVVGEYEVAEESGSEVNTPELDPNALFIRLKEAQYQSAVAEAELAKIKTKLVMLENSESQRKIFEKKCEEMAQRLRETEKSMEKMQRDLAKYQASKALQEAAVSTDDLEAEGDMLDQSKGQYLVLEQEMKGQYGTLEKKYMKAKKLIKEYQTREKEIMQERESVYQQQGEKEQQYNQLVKSLKDRIFELERNLNMPPYTQSKVVAMTTDLPNIKSNPPVKKDLPPLDDNISQISDDSGNILENGYDKTSAEDGSPLSDVPSTSLLDSSMQKEKSNLASSGALSKRKPPSRGSISDKEESDDEPEPFVQHDRDEESDASSQTSKNSGAYDPRQQETLGGGNRADLVPTSVDTADSGIQLISAKGRDETSSTASTASQEASEGPRSQLSQSVDFVDAQMVAEQEERSSASSSSAGRSPAKAQSTPMLANSSYQTMAVTDWRPAQVAEWAMAAKVSEQTTRVLREKQVDGPNLLLMDAAKLKQIGVVNAKDRDLLKKKVKDLKTFVEKERKREEKEQKAREKLEKQAAKTKKDKRK